MDKRRIDGQEAVIARLLDGDAQVPILHLADAGDEGGEDVAVVRRQKLLEQFNVLVVDDEEDVATNRTRIALRDSPVHLARLSRVSPNATL